MYVPRTALVCGNANKLILFEQERPPNGCVADGNILLQKKTSMLPCVVKFVPNHVIDGPTPIKQGNPSMQKDELNDFQINDPVVHHRYA